MIHTNKWMLRATLTLGLAAIALAPSVRATDQPQGQGTASTAGQGTASTASQEKPADATAGASGAASATGQGTVSTAGQEKQAEATAGAQAQASAEMSVEAQKQLEAVKEKGAKVSAQTRAKSEAKLQASAKKADDACKSMGDAKAAEHLAAEFGMTADQLMAEKNATSCSWGSLMIAHTLDANTKTEVTAQQLLTLNSQGVGWGQIAAGLGLKLSDACSAVQTESRVAAGSSRPDGKVAVIRGEGARVGLDGSLTTGVNAAGLDLGAHSGVGVGIKIKP